MAGTGVRWFNGPDKFEQRLSVVQNAIPGKAEEAVNHTVEIAVERMQDVVNAGGMNKTKKGGARRLSDEMFDSIKGKILINSRKRVQGEFGFVDPPDWTKYQERGTAYIAPMWAYAEGRLAAIDDFQYQIETTEWFATSKL